MKIDVDLEARREGNRWVYDIKIDGFTRMSGCSKAGVTECLVGIAESYFREIESRE